MLRKLRFMLYIECVEVHMQEYFTILSTDEYYLVLVTNEQAVSMLCGYVYITHSTISYAVCYSYS